jgi:hypothetical protein
MIQVQDDSRMEWNKDKDNDKKKYKEKERKKRQVRKCLL